MILRLFIIFMERKVLLRTKCLYYFRIILYDYVTIRGISIREGIQKIDFTETLKYKQSHTFLRF